MTTYPGIDYSLGQSNVDKATGIHYGVIIHHQVGQEWYERSEGYYGDPHCPKCGDDALEIGSENDPAEDDEGNALDREEYEVAKYSSGDYACDRCKYRFDGEEAFGESPISHFVDDGEYSAECHEDGDIFVMKSPYYSKSQFCSPCAPGAGYLASPCEDGVKTYCLGHEWFEDGKAPYPVYRVLDDSVVESEVK